MEITTINELKKHVGEYLAFVCKTNLGKDIVWIQKLYSVKDDNAFYLEDKLRCPSLYTGLYQLPTFGLFTAQVSPTVKGYTLTPKTPYFTNAQNIIRTPTKQEIDKENKYDIKGDLIEYKIFHNILIFIYIKILNQL